MDIPCGGACGHSSVSRTRDIDCHRALYFVFLANGVNGEEQVSKSVTNALRGSYSNR